MKDYKCNLKLIIMLSSIVIAIAAAVTAVVIFKDDICSFISKIGKKLSSCKICSGRKDDFSDFADM